jgi:soluble lytic murein transglycosylase
MKLGPLSGIVALVLLASMMGYRWWQWHLERKQDAPIRAAAQRYQVEPALVRAVIWRESQFHPRARGRVGELGLMQLREEAAQSWADAEHIGHFQHEQCFDPLTNILAGTWYLKTLLKRYRQTDNPVPYALADYNAGRGNVLKWLGGAGLTNNAVFIDQIGFPSTKQYVQSVMTRYGKYR